MVELRAYAIWVESGRPDRPAGEGSRKRTGWRPNARFETRSRPGHSDLGEAGSSDGAAGDAVREKNMRAAEAELLKETEDELRRHPLD